jgi:hypothetical protein
LKHGENSFRVIVGGDAIDGKGLAFHTFMDQHQLAAQVTLIFVAAVLQGQPDRPHRRFARGQTIARGEQIQVA